MTAAIAAQMDELVDTLENKLCLMNHGIRNYHNCSACYDLKCILNTYHDFKDFTNAEDIILALDMLDEDDVGGYQLPTTRESVERICSSLYTLLVEVDKEAAYRWQGFELDE